MKQVTITPSAGATRLFRMAVALIALLVTSMAGVGQNARVAFVEVFVDQTGVCQYKIHGQVNQDTIWVETTAAVFVFATGVDALAIIRRDALARHKGTLGPDSLIVHADDRPVLFRTRRRIPNQNTTSHKMSLMCCSRIDQNGECLDPKETGEEFPVVPGGPRMIIED